MNITLSGKCHNVVPTLLHIPLFSQTRTLMISVIMIMRKVIFTDVSHAEKQAICDQITNNNIILCH